MFYITPLFLLRPKKITQIMNSETITAQATPPGRGGISVIRVSGSQSQKVAEAILGHCPKVRYAEYLPFKNSDGEIIDEGIAIFYKAPHSFTGEDVLELQGHGGQVVADRIIQAVMALGVRAAKPGEFSERAFMNDKLDLAQAEAIADLIDATSEEAAKSAIRSLKGDFSQKIHELVESLISLRIYVESAIDFPEEEIDFLADGEIERQLNGVIHNMDTVQNAARQGSLLREGMQIALAGKPNAGKSSLLNALAGEERAIVTDIAGTTRDLLKQEISIDGMPLHIIDTAGLRDSNDAVEQEGIRRAWDAIEKADKILLLIDSATGFGDEEKKILKRLPERIEVTIIENKIDLQNKQPELIKKDNRIIISLSAKTGTGIDLLRQHLKASMGYLGHGEGSFMARRRHLDAIARARASLDIAAVHLQQRDGELVAEECRQAQQNLSEITGEFTSDDLLGKIFTSFCIGK